MIRFLTVAFFTIVVMLFGIANLHVVELKTVFSDDVRASLTFLLFAAFVAGFILATLLGLHQAFKNRRQDREHAQPWLPVGPPRLPPPPRFHLQADARGRGSVYHA